MARFFRHKPTYSQISNDRPDFLLYSNAKPPFSITKGDRRSVIAFVDSGWAEMNEIVLKGEEATQDAKHTHMEKISMSSKKGKNGFKPMLRIRTEKSSMTKTHKGKSKRVTPFSPAAEPPRRSIEKAIMDSPTYTVVEVPPPVTPLDEDYNHPSESPSNLLSYRPMTITTSTFSSRLLPKLRRRG